jgi:UDP-N-acetylglucosamine 2-epimerase
MLKVLTIFGTRPEAIKLAPVLMELEKYSDIKSYVCVTAQHRQMLDHVLNIFDIVPDFDLDLMQPGQSLSGLTARVLTDVCEVIKKVSPDLILVQGDTTTVMSSSLAAFYHNIPLGHIEAGLRTGNSKSPFPEEMNRRVTSLVSDYHFAPTVTAKKALLQEGIPDSKIFLTGNTVIDALELVLGKQIPCAVDSILSTAGVVNTPHPQKLILVTAHRRENFGEPIESICGGLQLLANRNKNYSILYPVHLNPKIRGPVFRNLEGIENISLIDPVEYDVMAHLMKASDIILTDSGGIQEEAPALGKPVLVMRTETERPDGIDAGTARLIGPDKDNIVNETERLLRNEDAYQKMSSAVSPYGDGQAASRIVEAIASEFSVKE